MIAMTTSSSIRVKARERACRMKSPLMGRNPGIRSSNAMKDSGVPESGRIAPAESPAAMAGGHRRSTIIWGPRDDPHRAAGGPPPGPPGLPFFGPPAVAGPLLIGIPAAAGGRRRHLRGLPAAGKPRGQGQNPADRSREEISPAHGLSGRMIESGCIKSHAEDRPSALGGLRGRSNLRLDPPVGCLKMTAPHEG